MTGFERRWARALLEAFAPRHGPGLSPRGDEVAYLPTLQRMMGHVQPRAALGLRLAIWVAALAPMWLWGQLGTVTSLARERRTRLLSELLKHRSFAVRELVLLLKFAACLALFSSDTLRARSSYDDAQSPVLSDSGMHPTLRPERRRLRVWAGDATQPVAIDDDREAS